MTEGSISDVPRVAVHLLDGLTAAGLKTALGGGLALNLWVQPRTTKDVDLNVFVEEGRHAELLRVLEQLGCVASRGGVSWNDDRRAEFLRCAREGEVAVAWYGEVRIDVFVPSIPFYQEAERTLREVDFAGDGKSRLVLSPEALSVFKLLFFRERDINDLRRMVAARRDGLDTVWIRRHLVSMVGEDDERVETWDEIVRIHGSETE